METPVPPSNAAKRHRVCVDKDVAIVSCVDGDVAMSAAEFHRLLDSGNVLRQLIYGGEGMIEELNLDVFRRFGVTVGGLCAIRACVRSGGVLPDDEDALAYWILHGHELWDVSDGRDRVDAHDDAEVPRFADAPHHVGGIARGRVEVVCSSTCVRVLQCPRASRCFGHVQQQLECQPLSRA